MMVRDVMLKERDLNVARMAKGKMGAIDRILPLGQLEVVA
jgi:hypothetical protein